MSRAWAVLGILLPCAAWPCGGFYANDVEVDPDQKIVLLHREGIETYIFRPHFCGAAKDFGVILPIPSTLTMSPELADNALFEALDAFTAPEVVEECIQHPLEIGCGATRGGLDFVPDGGIGGLDVIDRGRVGIFDFVLLQATSVSAFTDWLDQNGFPRGAAAEDVYGSYVSRGWFFVAFKVSADTVAPAEGKKLCGDLGPIALSFAAPKLVVPARIASVNGARGTWRLFVAGAAQKALDAEGAAAFSSSLYFSRALHQDELRAYGALAAVTREGERLTALDVSFGGTGATADIGLVDAESQDFRTTLRVYRECPGKCSTGPGTSFGLMGALVLLGLGRMRRGSKTGMRTRA